MKLYLVYFSPAHTTKKIVATVGKVFFERLLCRAQLIDLTNIAARSRAYAFEEDDVVVFGAPVYGGRLPQLLVPVLQNMQGGGARAVVLSVYGNRDYDDALLETADLFAERGFRVCAAAAFIGEHSYSAAVAKNRPDAEDLIAATTFGVAAFANVEQGCGKVRPLRGVHRRLPRGKYRGGSVRSGQVHFLRGVRQVLQAGGAQLYRLRRFGGERAPGKQLYGPPPAGIFYLKRAKAFHNKFQKNAFHI